MNKQCKCGVDAIKKTSAAGNDYWTCSKRKNKKEGERWIIVQGCDFYQPYKVVPQTEQNLPVIQTQDLSTPQPLNTDLKEIKLQLDTLPDVIREIIKEELELSKVPF